MPPEAVRLPVSVDVLPTDSVEVVVIAPALVMPLVAVMAPDNVDVLPMDSVEEVAIAPALDMVRPARPMQTWFTQAKPSNTSQQHPREQQQKHQQQQASKHAHQHTVHGHI